MSGKWYSNYEYGDEIICPYCGKKYEPIPDSTLIGDESVDYYNDGELGEFTCDGCKKKFALFVELKYMFTTETLSGEMTEEEYYNTDNF